MTTNHLLGASFLCLSIALFFCSHAFAVDFEKDILPILKDRCFDCHGEDKQKSGLRLDKRAILLNGGDSGLPTIVPGNVSKSYLIEVINGSDPDMIMPPKGKALTKEQVALFESWIKEGANWPGQMEEVAELTTDHWSFQPVVRPEVPGKAKNPVDAFLNDKLKEAGLTPNQSAPAKDLIRRASVILTGLLPTPEKVATFEKNFSNNPKSAYAQLIDDLMASPHFGERWAQHWLDVIRWAETNGSEANLYRKNAWFYRDYVVRAFNEDVPYNQFIQEQISGDTMGAGDATGFLVAGPHVPAATVGREPAAIRQARADRMDEIMQTIGASIMGVTMGCARCHSHKFDPITIQDYYAMTAVFEDVEFGSRFPEFSDEHPRKKKGMAVWKDIASERKKLREFGGWEEDWGAFRELHFPPVKTKAVRIQFKMPNVSLDELEVLGPPSGNNASLSLARKGVKMKGFPDGGRNHISRINDGEYGTMAWRANVGKNGKEKPWVVFEFEKPETIGRIRMSANREYFYDTDYLDKKPYLPKYNYDLQIQQEDGTWKNWVGTWWVNNKLNEQHPVRPQIQENLHKHIQKLAAEGPRPSFVGRFVYPKETRVLLRGSPENPRDPVDPAGPKILNGDLGITQKATGKNRRREFAEWISSETNPLTARVMVNRIWHHVFGSGIVTTTSDFGVAGAPPSHPELLDWLAAEFVTPSTEAEPWSMKTMIRLLVMSDAFRRSSTPNPENLQIDATSALLWRFPPRRVEAEVIRDSILQASGKLDTTIGGKSFRIHNVKKTYAQWEVVNNHASHTWRRMLYQERMRRVDDQIFTAFDFPDCGQVRAKRPVSTTPLQALNLLNSPFAMEQSKFLAQRAEKEAGKGEDAVEFIFQQLLSREPDHAELKACEDVPLHLVCRSLMNANEFVFLP